LLAFKGMVKLFSSHDYQSIFMEEKHGANLYNNRANGEMDTHMTIPQRMLILQILYEERIQDLQTLDRDMLTSEWP